MTYEEYDNLQIGDVVYYVNVRWQKMTIEPRKVVEIFDLPSHSPFIENGEGFFKVLPVDRYYCFLNLDEASRCLEACVNHEADRRKKNYALAPTKAKSKYIYALTIQQKEANEIA